ncbi:MAG: glutamate racemase [Bacteroidales bacterium]|nr:glutamate racemase [Bacteroidales bacterium]
MASIGIFDSGSGGLSVLREIRKILPDERYIYYSDNAYCPYGEKSAEFVTGRSRAVTDLLLSKGASAVVVACNTATAAAIATLRSEYDIPFVGMEPAVKPAASGTRSGVVGVLATAGTLKAPKYLNTKEQYAEAVQIEERVGKGFVELVENLDLDSPHAESVVRASLQPLLDAGADTVVLGCTHYPFLLPLMRRIAPPDVHFIDPAPAVARRLLDVLKMSGIALYDSNPGVELFSSGPDTTLGKLFAII